MEKNIEKLLNIINIQDQNSFNLVKTIAHGQGFEEIVELCDFIKEIFL